MSIKIRKSQVRMLLFYRYNVKYTSHRFMYCTAGHPLMDNRICATLPKSGARGGFLQISISNPTGATYCECVLYISVHHSTETHSILGMLPKEFWLARLVQLKGKYTYTRLETQPTYVLIDSTYPLHSSTVTSPVYIPRCGFTS